MSYEKRLKGTVTMPQFKVRTYRQTDTEVSAEIDC